MASEKLAVNLIPKEEIRKRTWGNFLNWVLTYGRYIIIGTEIVLLLVLLFRFKLDRDLKNLSDDLKEKQVKIQSMSKIEEQARLLQAHLATIRIIETQTIKPSIILKTLSPLAPPDVIFEQLTTSSSEVQLSARAFSLEGFALFINNLKRSKQFENVSLERLSQEGAEVKFSLKLSYKKG